MANVTASMAVTGNVLANQSFVITMTLANASSGALTVAHIEAAVSPPGGGPQSCSYSMGVPPLGPNNPATIPANGTLLINWPCVIFAPQQTFYTEGATPAAFQHQLNAVVTTNDTTPVIYAAPLGVTVSSFLKASDQFQGGPVAPNTNPGQAVFSQPTNSGLLVVLGM